MLPRMSAKPINRLLRCIGRGNVAFLVDDGGRLLQHEFGQRSRLGREDLCRGLLVDGVSDRFGLVLRVAQFVEQRFGLLPILPCSARPSNGPRDDPSRSHAVWMSFQSAARSVLNTSLPVISQPRSDASDA